MQGSSDQLIFRILEIESRAGRIEGMFSADWELGRMWRGQQALTEACRSVGMEDIHVFEGDVIHRHLENRMTDAEGARGAATVSELLRVIVAPGNLATDAERVVERCRRAAVSVEKDDAPLDMREIAAQLERELTDAPTPLLGALRAATIFRMMTQSSMPSADRLIFMAAENSLRGAGQGSDMSPDRPDALLRRMDASWIFTPSVALTQGKFRAWSPGASNGFHDLLDGVSQDLDRTLGAMPLLRRWRADARAAAAGRHGKSKLRDLVELVIREPILSAPHVRNMLGVSDRTSLYLMEEAQSAGILTLITPRRSHRVWAQPQMANLLRMRASRSTASWDPVRNDAPDEATRDVAADTVQNPQPGASRASEAARERAEFDARAKVALAELDAAMKNADAVLAKYRKGER